MKAIGILLFGVAAAASSHAQLTVTHFDRSGLLVWTNHLCTTRPVYEVLSAASPTGPWEHVAFVTNETVLTTTNPVAGGGARFYKLEWVDDAPWELNYAYDEGLGLGCPAAVGQMTITFPHFPSAGTGAFVQTDCSLFELHPDGTRPLRGRWYSDSRLVLVLDPSFDYVVWLDGTVERSDASSACRFTRYSGIVYEELLGSSGPIGFFVAEPAP